MPRRVRKLGEPTKYVCIGCKAFLTVKEVREDVLSKNLCTKCRDDDKRRSTHDSTKEKP